VCRKGLVESSEWHHRSENGKNLVKNLAKNLEKSRKNLEKIYSNSHQTSKISVFSFRKCTIHPPYLRGSDAQRQCADRSHGGRRSDAAEGDRVGDVHCTGRMKKRTKHGF
jgi:hypothetical protein